MLSFPFVAVDSGGAAPLVRLGWTVVVGLVTALGVASAVLFLPTDVLIAAIGDGLLVAVVVIYLVYVGSTTHDLAPSHGAAQVLDELERSDPQAVCRWLQRHPRASSAPS